MRMTQKGRLVLIAAVVAVMVALVMVFAYREERGSTSVVSQRWLPDLAARLAQLDRVRLRSATSVATLVRDGDRWIVEERSGFPADFPRLQALLDSLAVARLIERKTAQPEYFERLGLSDIEQPDSEAVQVEVWAASSEPLARVLLGNSDSTRKGRFVRGANEQQTWLIDTAPTASADPADWIERKSLGVPFDRVALVEREFEGKPVFRAERDTSAEGTSLTAVSLPAGKAPRYLGVFDAAARSILTMEPEDVRRASDIDFAAAALTRIVCFDGLVIEARALKMADGNWMTLAARVDESLARPDAAARAVSSESAAQQSPSAQSVGEEASGLEQRVAGWAFKVSDYVQGEATKPLADYLQDDRSAAEPARK